MKLALPGRFRVARLSAASANMADITVTRDSAVPGRHRAWPAS